jgi:predicted kinase
MRKWMRERIKRRKKSETSSEGTPAPLQPAYFDVDAAASKPASAAAETPAPEAAEPEESAPESATQEAEAGPGGGDGRQRRRRRRGRGGRGRNRATPAPAVVQTEQPSSAEATASVVEAEIPHETPQATPAQMPPPQVVTPRAPKGVVVLAIGLPGSGKSSWFKRHNITALSSDLLRALLFDDPTEQRFQDLVFSNLRSMLKARLIARRPMNYVDATNLTAHDRHGWIKLARDFGYEVQAVFFDVPVEVCLERNQRRSRVVGDDVVRRMAGKLKPPTFEEGFSKITVVRVKQKAS